MALEQRIKRLEEKARPKGLFTRKRCHQCGQTDQEIPPQFEGLVINLIDYRPCSHGTNHSAKSELVANMTQA